MSEVATPGKPRRLSDRVLDGDPRAIARAISLIEDEAPQAAELVRALFPHTGGAYLVGITGPPGAGKSTLVDRLTAQLRQSDETVGVIAVDPTSPYTGGAILGDRVRMQAHAGDAGVFIRSMATRGHLGGLARATHEAAQVLDAAGYDWVVIETVGVGQDEVDIVRAADISIVTLVPGAGDDVQAMKAGIMEIADVFVVNKADREGADHLVASIEAMLALEPFGPDQWRPPVVRTQATTGAGVPDLAAAIDAFRAHAAVEHISRRRVRDEFRLRELLASRFMDHVEAEVFRTGELAVTLDQIADRTLDPYSAAAGILARALGRGGSRPVTLDHIGIAVREIAEAIAFYRDALGLEVVSTEEVAAQGVRAHFVPVGESSLELLEPTTADSPIATFVEKRGPGVHHITLRVADIRAALARLRDRGIRLIDDEPRAGAGGALVAFVHPSSAHGVLVELKQVVKD
jgi:LAO/AO transport system kinase